MTLLLKQALLALLACSLMLQSAGAAQSGSPAAPALESVSTFHDFPCGGVAHDCGAAHACAPLAAMIGGAGTVLPRRAAPRLPERDARFAHRVPPPSSPPPLAVAR